VSLSEVASAVAPYLNTVGAIRLAQAVLPRMPARGDGKLVFVSGIAGRVELPPAAAYAATK
jgi:short-subunit dehydrogenase